MFWALAGLLSKMRAQDDQWSVALKWLGTVNLSFVLSWKFLRLQCTSQQTRSFEVHLLDKGKGRTRERDRASAPDAKRED